jgi:hypothetical protein
VKRILVPRVGKLVSGITLHLIFASFKKVKSEIRSTGETEMIFQLSLAFLVITPYLATVGRLDPIGQVYIN